MSALADDRFNRRLSDVFIHPHALVESEDIGRGTRVWAFAHVMSGAMIGCNVNVCDHAFIESGVTVGDNVTIKNAVCLFEGVHIADDVFIGPRVVFTNDRFPRSPRMDGVEERYSQKSNWLDRTFVQRGVSIGAAVTITPGVTLGTGCMVGSGSTVTKDVPPFSLVIGSPARVVSHICGCGQKLGGNYDEVDCSHCGQTAAQRRKLVAMAK